MIDKYLLEDLSLRSDEKGELARWVIQLQADVDTERRQSASLESVIYARDTRIAELEAEITNIVDSHAETVAELRAKLATPVRLPRPACTYADHSYPAYSRKQVEEIITSAGMRFTVEGDE
ncbi:hypothetical protein SME04J_04490 [Serratia marcescens]|nr:hypothetical protein SME04J_04490 [Serratia marcescens]